MIPASKYSTSRISLHTHSPQIINKIYYQIESGIQFHKAVRIPNRLAAIAFAIRQADLGDLILVAGKGHETTQVLGSERIPFSDQTVVANLLEEIC